MRTHQRVLGLGLIIAAVGLLSGCIGGTQFPVYHARAVGSPQNGKAVIEQFRCGSCHIIPGIPNAHGVVGPPLDEWSNRTFIAGEFPNDPKNLVHWIEAPTSMKPKTDMPDLGLNHQQASDVAVYLETLR